MATQTIAEKIGAIIRKFRRKSNLTQKELGAKLDVTNACISKYENGKLDVPFSCMEKIADICHFSLREYAVAFMDEEEFARAIAFMRNRDNDTNKPQFMSLSYTSGLLQNKYAPMITDFSYEVIHKVMQTYELSSSPCTPAENLTDLFSNEPDNEAIVNRLIKYQEYINSCMKREDY